MGQLKLRDLQKLLGLDVAYPYFPTREEELLIHVDGVLVSAIVTYAWRSESIRLVEPFEVHGSKYGFGFTPPLFALGESVRLRQQKLDEMGRSVHDHWMEVARELYRMHFCYLKKQHQIEKEQRKFSEPLRSELELLRIGCDKAHEEMISVRRDLRSKLESGMLSQAAYQVRLGEIKKKSQVPLEQYESLRGYIARECGRIREEHINHTLPCS